MRTKEPTIGKRYHKDIVLRKWIARHNQNITDALIEHGKEVTVALSRRISTGSRSGRIYRIRGRDHQASAPGEAPANRSGKLAGSFGFRFNKRQLTVGSDAFSKAGAPYPTYLQEGTPKMEPRPWFVEVIEALRYRLERDLQDIGLL